MNFTPYVFLSLLFLTYSSSKDVPGEVEVKEKTLAKQILNDSFKENTTLKNSPQVYSYKENAFANQILINSFKENTTVKNSPQIYSYNPQGGSYIPQGGSYNPTFYDNNNPSYIPTYNPVIPPTLNPYDPSNPAYNPAYNPSLNPGSYNPSLNPGYGFGNLDAFTARRAYLFSQVPGGRVKFSETVTQEGSGWRQSNSEFVATIPGIYFFTFQAVSERNSYFRLSLVHNGRDTVSAYGDLSGYQMGGNSAVLRLNSGDRVWLQLQEGRLYEVTSSRAYTTFSGFQIQ